MSRRPGLLGLAREALATLAERGAARVAQAVSGAPRREGAAPQPVRTPASPAAPAAERLRDRDVMATSDRAVLADLMGLRLVLAGGARPRLVVHWATWCEACVEELEALVALRRRFAGRLDVVGIGWEAFSSPSPDPRDHLRAVEACAAAHGVDFETLVFEGTPDAFFEGLEAGGQVRFAVRTVPQLWLVPAGGGAIRQFHGPLDAATTTAIADAVGPAGDPT